MSAAGEFDIAIIGMALRVPGAQTPEQFWENLRAGVESIEQLDDEQLAEMEAKYAHPLTRTIGDIARKVGGHGGMDFIMCWRLVDCMREGLPPDMDVYDAAANCHRICGPNHVVGTGCEVPPETPPQNLHALVAYARDHGPSDPPPTDAQATA